MNEEQEKIWNLTKQAKKEGLSGIFYALLLSVIQEEGVEEAKRRYKLFKN